VPVELEMLMMAAVVVPVELVDQRLLLVPVELVALVL
jgi:hypothetical protein